MRLLRTAAILAATALAALFTLPAVASSHSDAPLSKQDPQTNLTDVYAFVGTKYDAPGTPVLNVIINVHPFCEPGDGIMYDRFADDALYSINIANPATGANLVTYNFRFSPVSSAAGKYKNLGTAFSYGRGTAIGGIADVDDARQNFTQSYTLERVTAGTSTTITMDSTGHVLNCPPPNVGPRTTPAYNGSDGRAISGATTNAGLDKYTKQTVYSLSSGEAVWAGEREDSFFSDIPGIFDLLDSRILGADGHGQTGNGVDGFKGYNVLTYALQIPLASLPQLNYNDAFTGASHGVGVYASVSRQRIKLLNTSADPANSGAWVQVNRLANPFMNELLVAVKDKDNYNRAAPTGDSAFATYVLNPEAAVLINTVFGTGFVTTNRTDLAAVYIPDVVRVDTTTGPVPLVGQGGNRLSGLGGDTTGGKWSGWPNGRRLGDDVADIALTAIASGPTFSSIFVLGDNVTHNDATYNFVFPYAATPWGGTRNSKDSGPNVGF